MRKLVLILFLSLLACDKFPEKRMYVERILPDQIDHASDSIPTLAWDIPQGWGAQEGEGMRLVTFYSQDEDPITCTIIALTGDAGGLKANVLRWMRQIDIVDIPDNELDIFLRSQESITSRGGFNATLVDLTQLPVDAEPGQSSIIAAIFRIREQSYFIKMTGSMKALKAQRDKFKHLCQSLRMS